MAYLSINDLKIYYELHGEGPLLILIAGYTCDVSFWSTVLDPLSKQFKVLTFDNRGAGRTDTPDTPYSIETMADDTLRLAKALGFSQYMVLGHSMGGCIAQQIAYKAPHRIVKLILANTSASFSPGIIMNFQFFHDLHALGTPVDLLLRGFMPWLYSDAFLSNQETVRTILKKSQDNPCLQSLLGERRQMEAIMQFDSRGWCSSIRSPTLILAGEKDLLSPVEEARYLAKELPNSQLVILPNMGHLPLIEQPQIFLKTVLKFSCN